MKVKVETPERLQRLTKHRKRCRVCGEIRVLSDFNTARGNRDGLRNECRTCAAQQARQRRLRTALAESGSALAQSGSALKPYDWGNALEEQLQLPVHPALDLHIEWDEDGEPHVEILS